LNTKFEGIKTTLWTALVVAMVFFAAHYSQNFWQQKMAFIEQVIYGLSIVGILLSAQFGRSRFALLISLWTLYYSVQNQLLPGKVWLETELEWLFVSGILSFFLLSVLKDRRVLSVFGLLWLCSIIVCVVLAKAWLYGVQWWLTYSQVEQIAAEHYRLLSIDILFYATAVFILYKSLRTASLLVASLFTSLIIWGLLYYQYLYFSLSMMVCLLCLHYILVVIIDSYFLAYRDELTKLPSRRALQQYTLSLGRQYTVGMVDIDHFKKFNDNYGHDIGDQVLKLVAAKIAQVKGGGRVFRFGGEEFIVVFPGKDVSESALLLENIRQIVADYSIVIRHPIRKSKKSRKSQDKKNAKSVSVSISIGVATRKNKESFDETVKNADQALYRAKKNGRNNVSY
jgi:diguanylate cyclase (GGDEF)-like protein